VFLLITHIYKINPDNTYGGMEESYSDVDIDLSMYTAPNGYTFKPPINETDIWNGRDWAEFVPPALDEIKNAKIAEINEAFDAHVAGRTSISLGWDMQFNKNDLVMVDGAVRYLEMTGGVEGYLTDADNINHYGLSIQQMKQAALEMTGAHMQAHAHKQQLRDLINSATSIESLSGVVWLL